MQDRNLAFLNNILVSLMRGGLVQLNLLANYGQNEQLDDNHAKMEISAFAQHSPAVKGETGTNRCIQSVALVTLGRQTAAQSF